MAFQLITADDDRTRFTTTFTKDGEELTFSVPLMTFIDADSFREFAKWSQKNPDDKLLRAGIRPLEAAFDWWMDRLKPEGHEQFKQLVFGEKEQLWKEWNRLTEVPMGESAASSAS